MTHSRRDQPGRHFDADRIVMARGHWYVMTRERMDVGPFETEAAARTAAAELAQALDGIDDPAVVIETIQGFMRRFAPPD